VPDVSAPGSSALRERLLEVCAGDESSLRAIVDGARVPGLAALLDHLPLRHHLLGAAEDSHEIAHALPRLVELEPRPEVLGAFDPWLLPATIFVVCAAPIEQLRMHLKRFLVVLDGTRREVLLRFYDPRTVAPFLDASTDDERRLFFGPIQRLAAPTPSDPDGRWLRFDRPPGAVLSGALPARQRPFALSRAHEDAFRSDSLARYETRVVAYLRQVHPARALGQEDALLRALVGAARRIGAELGVIMGRDVTRLAEVLLLGGEAAAHDALGAAGPETRPAQLLALRDRLAAAEASGLG